MVIRKLPACSYPLCYVENIIDTIKLLTVFGKEQIISNLLLIIVNC